MCQHYERLLREGASLLRQISPAEARGDHCPEAADAVHDFLTTGSAETVRADFGTTYQMPQGVLSGFRRIARLEDLLERLGRQREDCSHVVVRAVRSQPREGETPHHYFVLANIHGQLVVFDAYGHLVIQGAERILTYTAALLHVPPGYFEFTSTFDVTATNPLDDLFPDL